MDVHTMMDGQRFVWDSDKAASNQARHGVYFEDAREAFFDFNAVYEDAGPPDESRQACIGFTRDYQLLFVVHVLRDGSVLRLISARFAAPAERRHYDDEND